MELDGFVTPAIQLRIAPHHSALLFCNGDMAASDVVRQLARRADLLICADGGANAASGFGLTPDLVIGDFDSIRPEVRDQFVRAGVPCVLLERQDDTDFEKALLALHMRGITRVLLVGATGGLLDHTLGNLSIIVRYVGGMRFVLFDSDYRIDVVTCSMSFPSTVGERVSITPLAASEGVSFTGLKYPLFNARMAVGELEGTCNEALGDRFEVRMESGILLVFRALDQRGEAVIPEDPEPLEEN